MIQSFLKKISRTPYVQSAMADRADLGALRKRPTPRITFGLFLIVFSYLVGLPAVSALGVLSVYCREPLLLGIGGPAVYVLSQLIFIAGMYFAGAKYARIFMRWATRKFMEKMMEKSPAVRIAAGSRTSMDRTN